MDKKKSFTLIELLVVIVIIGVIASIVLVATRSARDKAKIAKGLQFASSVHHVIGAYAVGIWEFDEGSGSSTADVSGNENNGTIIGASWTAEGDTPSEEGYALSFDGSADYVTMGDVLDQPTNSFTLVAWVKSTSTAAGNNNGVIYKRGTAYSYSEGYRLNMPNGAFNLHIANGTASSSLTAGSGYNDGSWHLVVGVVKRNDELRIYVDGVSVSNISTSLQGSIDSSVHLAIGSLTTNGSSNYHNFNGTIDEVRIYEQALSSAQIRKLYVEGARKHRLLAEE